MKKLLISSCTALATLLSLNTAQAADLSRPAPVYKAPPIMAPLVFSWTGLYLGIDGGWGWGRENYTDNFIGPVSHRPDGGLFGGVLGYRYQIGQFVLGLEGTAAWADINDTVGIPGTSETLRARAIYTATGQAGFAFGQALLYAKGGWAGVNVRNSLNSPGVLVTSNTQNDNGWTAGVGLDYAAWQNVVLGIEYDHIDVGYNSFATPAWVVAAPSRFTIDQVVGRLTYKFQPF